MRKLKHTTGILTLISFFSGAYAQEVVSTQGDYYTANNSSIEFTIGEVVIETTSSTSNTLTQGFHQTQLIVSSIKEEHLPFEINVFPNPVAAQLTITIDKEVMYNAVLLDMNGNQLELVRLTSDQNILDVANYARGIYMLTIKDQNNQIITSYKITKN